MISIRRVLFPTDFSEPSEHAMNHALDFARLFKARLHLLHVVDESFQYWMASAPSGMPLGPSQDQVLSNSMQRMKDFVSRRIPQTEADVVTSVTWGRPAAEILRHAKDQQIDLIVIGTHGRSGLAHALMGSVAEKVVRQATCPVLTIRAPGAATE